MKEERRQLFWKTPRKSKAWLSHLLKVWPGRWPDFIHIKAPNRVIQQTLKIDTLIRQILKLDMLPYLQVIFMEKAKSTKLTCRWTTLLFAKALWPFRIRWDATFMSSTKKDVKGKTWKRYQNKRVKTKEKLSVKKERLLLFMSRSINLIGLIRNVLLE